MVLIDDTLAFVRGWLPSPPLRLLEIGASAGELTEALLALGYTVTALDSHPNAVAAAQVRGLPVRLATWPSVMPTYFDAALLVRTLHHLGNLDEALSAVRAVLPRNGLVLGRRFRLYRPSRQRHRLAPAVGGRGARCPTSLFDSASDHPSHVREGIAHAIP